MWDLKNTKNLYLGLGFVLIFVIASFSAYFWIAHNSGKLSSLDGQQSKQPTPPEQSTHTHGDNTHWIVKHNQDIRDTWASGDDNMRGSVKFVIGNNIWQPGAQFSNSNNWLALTCTEHDCKLQASSLSVKPESWQGHYDDTETEGQNLSFKSAAKSGEVVAWFKTTNAPEWLKAGEVTTYYSLRSEQDKNSDFDTAEIAIHLPNGETQKLVPMLLTRKLAPELVEKLTTDDGESMASVYLQLRTSTNRQLLVGTLADCSGVVDPYYLLWAGDLDRDGKADYLISFVDASGPVHLYLSSAAKSDQLVGLAGIHISPPFGGECDGNELSDM